MNNEIIEGVSNLLKYVHPNTEIIANLQEIMVTAKKGINRVLGLKESNNYRRILEIALTDMEFEIEYPYCFKLVKHLAQDKEFSIINNYIMVGKNRMKLSKYLNKFSWEYDIPKVIYRGAINELGRSDSTAIFDVAKSKSLVISTNMYDFLTSATNTSYRSCYTLDGSHFNGNISYCQDSFTAIIYSYTKDITRKIGRIYIYVFPHQNTFVVSRVYGSMYSAEIRKVTNEIQARIDSAGEWNTMYFEYYSDMYNNARPHYNGPLPVYFDAGYTRIFSTNKHIDEKSMPFLDFKYSICLKCGRKTTNGHFGVCERCQENVGKCRHCNTPVTNDYQVNGHKVCPECKEENYFECVYCGGFHPNDYKRETPEGEIWCTYCFNDYYIHCGICNTIYRRNTGLTIKRLTVCPDCVTKYVVQCSDCGTNLINKNEYRMVYKLDDELLCKQCYSQKDGNSVFIAGKYRPVYKEDSRYNIDDYYTVAQANGNASSISSDEASDWTYTSASSHMATDRMYFTAGSTAT